MKLKITGETPEARSGKRFYLIDIFIGPRCPWGGVWSMGPDLSNSIQDYFANLTDVTLADEDSNSTPADYVKRAILGNVAMQVAPPGGQNWN